MGRRSTTGGVAPHGSGIQLTLYYRGQRIRPTLDLRPTEANLRHARRLLVEIRERIRHGTFILAAYFPTYAGVIDTRAMSFADYAKRYEASLSKKAAATREDYRKQLKAVWIPAFGERLIHEIRYSELEQVIGGLRVGSKTLNNYLIPLRGVFAFAIKDGAITKNPTEGIENAKIQKPQPDPFEQYEAELIIEDLRKHAHPQIANYFAAAFFGGFRPSEQIAI